MTAASPQQPAVSGFVVATAAAAYRARTASRTSPLALVAAAAGPQQLESLLLVVGVRSVNSAML